MKYWVCILTALATLLCVELVAQSRTLDSLRNVYETTESDTLKYIVGMRIYDQLFPKDTLQRTTLFETHRNLFDKLKKEQKKLGIEPEALKAYEAIYYRMEAYQNQYQSYTKAAASMQKSLSAAKESQNYISLIDAYNAIAVIEEDNNNIMKGIEYRLEALKICETKIKMPRGVGIACLSLGINYYTLGQEDVGVEYFKRAYLGFKEGGFLRGMSAALNNISAYYSTKSKSKGKDYLDSAYKYCQASLQIKRQIGDPTGLGISLSNLSSVYRRMNQLDSALHYAGEAIKNCEQYGRLDWLSGAYNNMSEILIARKNYKEALIYAKKGEKIAKSKQDLPAIMANAAIMRDVYVATNDYENAYKYVMLLLATRDSLMGDDTKAKMAKMEAQFNFDKQKYAQEIAQKEKDLEKEKQLAQSLLIRNTAIAGVVLLLLVALVFLINQRKVKRINKLLNIKNEEISAQRDAITTQNVELQQHREEILAINEQLNMQKDELQTAFDTIEIKNQHIVASIQSAQSIQESILPKPDRVGLALKDFFIINKPKDVVSGDFYWLGFKNDRKILALLDCTGHGVHGAFITLIAYNLLNKVILSKDYSEPADILEQLVEEIVKNLKQNENKNNDGFDIGICSINEEERVLNFSGANASLFYSQDGSLFEAKGTHKRIGGIDKRQHNKQFLAQTIQYNAQTTFYLSTDGYADQHGGLENKKMGKLKFTELLQEAVQKTDLAAQKIHFEQYLADWTAQTLQTDDILMIGFKLC